MIEAKELDYHPQGDLLTSRVAGLARQILPEGAKDILRQVVRNERAKYPLKDPFVADLGGFSARFWIRNHTDWYRIGSKDSEGHFAEDLISTVASSGGAFVDIGAAQGYYSIIAAKAQAQVYAIDPDPVSLRSIGENIALNPDVQARITVLPVALGNEDGEISLFLDKSGKYAPSLKRTVHGLGDETRVKVSRLDTLVDRGIVPIPEVIKIDVEGAEGMVIEGMRKILASESKPKHIFLEIHRSYLPLFGGNPAGLNQSLVDCGYFLPKDNIWSRRNEILCHFVAK